MSDKLDDIHRSIQAGFLALIARRIQDGNPGKTTAKCLHEALLELALAKAFLAESSAGRRINLRARPD